MKTQQLFLFIAMAFLGVAYTNCGQVGEISLKSVPVASNTHLAVDDTVQDVITNCQNAAANNKLFVVSQKVNFEDSRLETGKSQICEFSSNENPTANGNLAMNDSFMQSRYEQYRKLDLPANAVLCDIQMKNDLQSFRYDDVFFFSFNGFLLASNNKTAVKERLVPQSRKLSSNNFTDVYNYDWMALRTGKFQNVADDYCVGASEGLASCSWPISEQVGTINFTFAQPLLVSMSAGRPSDQQIFSFAITGDNDPKLDCYHEKLEFTMNVKYYIPDSL